jgi:two-component sensor histidine kinase
MHRQADSEQAARDAFLLQLSDTLCLLHEPIPIQAAAARCIGEHLCANRAFYAEIIGDGEVVIHQDFACGAPSIAGRHSPEFLGSEAAARLRRGETATIHGAANGEIASGLLVALVKGGRWTAAFGVHSAAPREWSSFEIDLLQQTAERTWSAVERAKAFLTEREALLSEANHRIRNILQLTASLIGLQANHVEDRRMRALFDETRNRVHAIAAVYESIRRSPDRSTFDVAAYARSLAQELLRLYGVEQRLQVRIEGQPAALDLHRAAPFGLLLNELVSNVCKHALAAGRRAEMSIRLACENGDHVLLVTDNGVGLPPGLDFHRTSSLGLRLVHLLAEQLGGEVTLAPGSGVHIVVRFPVVRSKEA